jgi:hypothetical protein
MSADISLTVVYNPSGVVECARALNSRGRVMSLKFGIWHKVSGGTPTHWEGLYPDGWVMRGGRVVTYTDRDEAQRKANEHGWRRRGSQPQMIFSYTVRVYEEVAS